MITDDKNINSSETNNPAKATTEIDRINSAITGERTEENIEGLQDDIIRNDTIPETSKDTPGSNGAFPVGAFDNSKD